MRPGDTWSITINLMTATTGTPTVQLLHNHEQDTAVTPSVTAGVSQLQWKVTSVIPSTGYNPSDSIEYYMTATSTTLSPATQSAIVARTYIDAPATIAANGIAYASFAADTKSDGIAQTGSTSSTIAFGSADTIANGLVNGTVNRDIKIVSGTGIGQIRSVSAISGASGAKIGTLLATSAGGLNWATVPDNTSAYAWGDSSVVAGTGGGGSGGISLAALQGELEARGLNAAYTTANTAATISTAVWNTVIETGYRARDVQKVALKTLAASISGNGTSTVVAGATLPTPTTGANTVVTATMGATAFADRVSTQIILSTT